MATGDGDRLASGRATKASYLMSPEITQAKWDAIWEEEPAEKPKTCKSVSASKKKSANVSKTS
jgi:hypothetical protein